jgi:hypothetical protein
METNRTFYLKQTPRPELTWNDIFLPLKVPDNCPPPSNISEIVQIILEEPEEKYLNETHLYISGCLCPLPGKGKTNIMGHMEMAEVAELLFLMKPDIYREEMQILSHLPFLTVPYDAVHVRRGDKITEVPSTPTPKYCQSIKGDKPVFIASDSFQNIEELKQNCTNWKETWQIIDPRYVQLRNGYFDNIKIGKEWSYEKKLDSYKMFLAEVIMMRYAQIFVGTGTSNVWQWIHVLRGTNRSISLD